jgi:hypothetical protein
MALAFMDSMGIRSGEKTKFTDDELSGFPVTRRSSTETVRVTIDLTARNAGTDAAGPTGANLD